MDLKTYEMLSLLSKTLAKISESDKTSALSIHSAKLLLHKCISQFSRQQHIHAQHYFCGHDDGMSSHKSVSMMSSLLVAYIQECWKGHVASEGNYIEEEEENTERIPVWLHVNHQGHLQNTIYCDPKLANMCFCDFCHSMCLKTKASQRVKSNNSCLGIFYQFELLPEHKLSAFHVLV